MKKKKFLLLLCLLVLVGCKRIPKLQNGEEVVVEVNGKQFTTEELYKEMKENYGAGSLVSMVDKYITSNELTDDMKKDAESTAKADYDYYRAATGDNWQNFLSQYGFRNEDEFLEQLKTSYEQELVLKKYVKTLIKDDEIQEYYNNYIEGEMDLRHILIIPENNDSMTEDDKVNAKNVALEKAKEIIKKLEVENVKEKFIELAKSESQDGTKDNGGLLENITPGQLVDSFYNAALKLEVGKYTTTPVETEYGYHIIYKESHDPKPSLDSVKDIIIDKIADELLNAENATYIYWAGLREKYNINIIDDVIKDNYNSAISQYKKN